MSVHWVDFLVGPACVQEPATETELDGGHQSQTHMCRSTPTHMCSRLFHSSSKTCSLLKRKKKSDSKLPLSHTFQSPFPEMSIDKKYKPSSELLPCVDKNVCVLYHSVWFYKSGLTLRKKYNSYSSIDYGHLSILLYINLSYLYLNVFFLTFHFKIVPHFQKEFTDTVNSHSLANSQYGSLV